MRAVFGLRRHGEENVSCRRASANGGHRYPSIPSRPTDRHHRARHGGDELRLAVRAEGIGLAVGDDDGAAGLGDRAAEQEALALARRQQIDLELDGQHRGVFRHQREGGIAAGRIQRGRDDAGMQETVLLGQRRRKRHLDLDDAGRHQRQFGADRRHGVLAREGSAHALLDSSGSGRSSPPLASPPLTGSLCKGGSVAQSLMLQCSISSCRVPMAGQTDPAQRGEIEAVGAASSPAISEMPLCLVDAARRRPGPENCSSHRPGDRAAQSRGSRSRKASIWRAFSLVEHRAGDVDEQAAAASHRPGSVEDRRLLADADVELPLRQPPFGVGPPAPCAAAGAGRVDQDDVHLAFERAELLPASADDLDVAVVRRGAGDRRSAPAAPSRNRRRRSGPCCPSPPTAPASCRPRRRNSRAPACRLVGAGERGDHLRAFVLHLEPALLEGRFGLHVGMAAVAVDRRDADAVSARSRRRRRRCPASSARTRCRGRPSAC